MVSKNCVNHDTQPAVSACNQCRKDLCKSCVMVTPTGTFCSSECSVLFREMRAHGGGKKSSGSALKLFLALLLVVAVVFLLHLAPQTKGGSFDLIGRFLK